MSDDPSLTYPSRVLRFCPRCGAADLDFTSLNAFVCRACLNPLFLNVASAVAGLIERGDGTILLARRGHDPGKGLLDVPGGFLDALESAESAIRREIREELCLDLEPLVYFGTFPNRYAFKGVTYFTCDIVFRATPRTFDSLQLDEEIAGVVFVRPEDVRPEELAFESVRAILDAYRRWRQSAGQTP
jgi:NAD+ diphosphatase